MFRLLFIFILIIVLGLSGWFYLQVNRRPSDKIVKISGPRVKLLKKETRKPLVIGFIPQGNVFLMIKRWQPLLDYLAKELNIPTEIDLRSTYQEIISALANEEIDICLTGAFVYVLTKEKADITPLVRRKEFGSPYYHGLIVVRKDREINDLKDLKGKTFAFIDKKSTTGYLLPITMMRKVGIADPNQYFSEVIFTQNHDSGILAVYKQTIDAAAISSTRWLPDAPLTQELKIIWKSKPLLLGPFSVRRQLDKNLMRKITDAFLKIGVTEDTKELSRHIVVKGFEKAYDEDYNVIREIKDGFTEN